MSFSMMTGAAAFNTESKSYIQTKEGKILESPNVQFEREDVSIATAASDAQLPVEKILDYVNENNEEPTARSVTWYCEGWYEDYSYNSMGSRVQRPCGLSSSAAFEVLIGTICNELFFEKQLTDIEIAQIGQYAENIYFGKPCGLLDQMASSVGGMVFIDFEHPDRPVVERIDFDFSKAGHALCIIDSGADHADLTDEYAAIPGEMKEVCACFGKEVLREIPEGEFFAALPELRNKVPDRAI